MVKDGIRSTGGAWNSCQVCCRGSWESEVLARVKRISGGGICVVCTRNEEEISLNFILGVHGFFHDF
jgi:hypothetical protein